MNSNLNFYSMGEFLKKNKQNAGHENVFTQYEISER